MEKEEATAACMLAVLFVSRMARGGLQTTNDEEVRAELGGVRRCGHGSTMRSSGVSSWRPCGAGEEPIESRGGGRWEITSSSRPGNGGDGESWGCWRGREVAGRGVGAAACTCDLVPVFIGR